jgi:Protein of unknown function (DUF2442)
MEVTPRLLEAKPTEGTAIRLRFEDGTAAEVDFSYLLDYEGVFLALRDPEYFRQVAIYPEFSTIFWPGEVDICPDKLYRLTQEAAAVPA